MSDRLTAIWTWWLWAGLMAGLGLVLCHGCGGTSYDGGTVSAEVDLPEPGKPYVPSDSVRTGVRLKGTAFGNPIQLWTTFSQSHVKACVTLGRLPTFCLEGDL